MHKKISVYLSAVKMSSNLNYGKDKMILALASSLKTLCRCVTSKTEYECFVIYHLRSRHDRCSDLKFTYYIKHDQAWKKVLYQSFRNNSFHA